MNQIALTGPCAKQRVTAFATINTADGDHTIIVGENVCTKPQSSCPRVAGEGYLKCHTVCGQLGHAEEVLIRQLLHLGIDLQSVSSIKVYGHAEPCDNCASLLNVYGLRDRTVFYPHAQAASLDDDIRRGIDRAYNLITPSSHSRFAPAIDTL